jgi:hypothetical protein
MMLRKPKRPRRYLAGGLDVLNDAQAAQLRPTVDDPLSLQLRAALEEDWKQRIRHLPWTEREAWLRRPDVIAVLTARRLADLRRPVLSLRQRLEQRVPSAAWFDAAFNEGAEFPPPGMLGCTGQVRYSSISDLDGASDSDADPWPRRSRDCHSHVLSATSRYCPPQNVGQEAFLDNLPSKHWRCFTGPVSPSAAAIRHIADRRAEHEERINLLSEDGRPPDPAAGSTLRLPM